MIISEAMHGALLPTLSARKNPQVWYTGSAVDQLVHDHGVVFARVRERGRKGGDPALSYYEWSIDVDHPDKVTPEMATDPELWRMANPALGVRIHERFVESEQRSMDPRTFAVERLGVGDWPRTDRVGER
jgi:phage terminase large subunit-like protein